MVIRVPFCDGVWSQEPLVSAPSPGHRRARGEGAEGIEDLVPARFDPVVSDRFSIGHNWVKMYTYKYVCSRIKTMTREFS